MGWATRWDYPSFFLRTCATAACTGRAGAEATKRASSLPEETWRCNGWMELRVTKRHQRYLSRIDQCCPFRALRGLVWVDASANRVATVYTSTPLCNRQLTERRILGVSLSRKSAFWAGDVTERRILGGRRDLDVTEKRILRVGLTKRRTLHASGRTECAFP